MAKAKEPQADQKTNGTMAAVVQTPGTLHRAKLAVMADVPYVQKSESKGLNYTFLSESELLYRLQPVMVREGLTIAPCACALERMEPYKTAKGATMNHAVIRVTYRLSHESGEFEEIQAFGEGADVGDKAVPKAMTSAFKYALRQAFMIETGDDPDYSGSIPRADDKDRGRQDDSRSRHGDNGRDDRDGQREPARESGRQEEPSRQEPAKDGRDSSRQDAGRSEPSKPPAAKASAEATEKFQKRLAGIKRAKELGTLDDYRKFYSADPSMTEPMIAELEAAYWKRKNELTSPADAGDDRPS